MEYQHPRYKRVVYVCGEIHPAVRPQAEQRRPAYEALKRALRERGYHSSTHEEKGDMWIECAGEFVPFWQA